MDKHEETIKCIFIRDFNMVDRKLLNEQFEKVDKNLLECGSFKEQKKLLVDYYTSMNFTRDFMVGRKLQLIRKMKYGFDFQLLEHGRNFSSFLIGIVTTLLLEKEWFVLPALIILLLFMFFLSILKDYLPIKDEECKTYEIRNFEIKLISRLLSFEKERVSLEELKLDEELQWKN